MRIRLKLLLSGNVGTLSAPFNHVEASISVRFQRTEHVKKTGL